MKQVYILKNFREGSEIVSSNGKYSLVRENLPIIQKRLEIDPKYGNDVGYLFDSGITILAEIYPNAKTWNDQIPKGLRFIISGLDIIRAEIGISQLSWEIFPLIKGIHKKYYFRLFYRDSPILIGDNLDVILNFKSALTFNKIILMRDSDLNLPSWYTQMLIYHFSETRNLEVFKSDQQIALLSSDENYPVQDLIDIAYLYARMGLFPKNVESKSLVKKGDLYVSKYPEYALVERISFNLYTQEQVKMMYRELSLDARWSVISKNLRIFKVDEIYVIDYISIYTQDIVKVAECRKFVEFKGKAESVSGIEFVGNQVIWPEVAKKPTMEEEVTVTGKISV